jgi:hypothetical protein
MVDLYAKKIPGQLNTKKKSDVPLIMCHMMLGELKGLDNLQNGASIDPSTGLREYSKLASIIEIPQIKEVFIEVAKQLSTHGKISDNLNRIYEERKKQEPKFKPAPADNEIPTSTVEKMGRGGDRYLAFLPINLVLFLIQLRGGEYSINDKTGLLEFGFFKKIFKEIARPFKSNVAKSIIRVGATVAGGLLGGPVGAGLGSALGNAATGADFQKSLMRGLGAGAIGYGAQGLGQAFGLGSSTPFTNGFFSGSNALASGLGHLGIGKAAAAASAGIPSIPTSAVGTLTGAASGASHAAAAATPASGSLLSSLGNIASNPLVMMGGMTYLNSKADKQSIKQQNELARHQNESYRQAREDAGFNLPKLNFDEDVKKKFVINPKYSPYNNENPYIEEKPRAFKTGGSVRPIIPFNKSKPILGPGDGQEDKIKTYIPAGAYIIDATSTSDLGNGSSSSGMKVLEKTVKKIREEYPTKIVKHVEKYVKKNSKLVPVYLANEEFAIDPVTVALKGGGSVTQGAKIFDSMVKKLRAHKNSNGLKLPPKAHDPFHYMS